MIADVMRGRAAGFRRAYAPGATIFDKEGDKRVWSLRHLLMACVILAALSAFNATHPPQALAGRSSWEAGLRAGSSFNDEDESFNQYDVFVSYGLPWSWQWGRAIQVDTNITASLGILDGGGETGGVGSLGFEFVFNPAGGHLPLELRAGSALTLISEHAYGEEDLGGPVQFTHHISLYYWFLENLSVLARVQHMSNAGIYSENPGVNTIMLAMVYRF